MAAYIHYSHFEVLRRVRQTGRGPCRRFVDLLLSWGATVLLIGSIGGAGYLLYLLLLKELVSV